MYISLFIEWIVIWFSIALPVWPIAILCINRCLSKGRLSGFLTWMWAATADACYGAVAWFGLTFISDFLIDNRIYLQIIWISFLIYLGIKTWLQKPACLEDKKCEMSSVSADYFSALWLTITNPMTIISFAAIFAWAWISATPWNYTSAFMLVLWVFVGSALWWSILSNSAAYFRWKADTKLLLIINKISSIMIILFALVMVLNMFFHN